MFVCRARLCVKRVSKRTTEIVCRLKALVRSLCEASKRDARDLLRYFGAPPSWIRRRVVDDREHGLRRRGSRVETSPGQRLMEHDAEREDVGPAIEGLRPCLLRGHVGELAPNGTALRRQCFTTKLRDAEVGD